MNTTTGTMEYTFKSEKSAHRIRRNYINRGCFIVSLIAYDPARNVYAFDVRPAEITQ